jgi:hypothetical protein
MCPTGTWAKSTCRNLTKEYVEIENIHFGIFGIIDHCGIGLLKLKIKRKP